jgi:hypothetical protein
MRIFGSIMRYMYSRRSDVDHFLSTGPTGGMGEMWTECLLRAKEEEVIALANNERLVTALQTLIEVQCRAPTRGDGGTRYLQRVLPHIPVFIDSEDPERRY